MMPFENQYVKLVMKNLIKIEGFVKSWTDKKSTLLTEDNDIIIIQNTLEDVSIIKIVQSKTQTITAKKEEIDKKFEEILDKPVPMNEQNLKAQKLADLRLEQAKIEQEIIASQFKKHEILNRKSVKYDQFGIFKK
jgi:hypothetical protein